MEYNLEKERIDVSLKVTAHDFELMLSRKFDQQVDITEIADSSRIGEYCQDYLRHNFQVSSEGELARFAYLGKEILEREELYFYFSFEKIKNPASLNILSNLLFSISDDQQNIVHYKYKDQTKSVTLVPAQNQANLFFE